MYKYIIEYRSDDMTFTNGCIIANGYDHRLPAFQKLIKVARESFPDIPDDNIECRTVIKSAWCEGQTVILFSLKPKSRPKSRHRGWELVEYIHDVRM